MPSEAEIQATLGDLFRILDEFLKYATSNSEKFSQGSGSHEGTFIANLKPDYTYHRDMVAAVENFREGLDTQLGRGREMIVAALREYAAIADIPEPNAEKILDRLWDRFHANSLTVKERNFTFGVPAAAGGNAGGVICNRLSVDKNGDDLEAQTPDAKVATCIADDSSGAVKWGETWEVRGQDAGRDRLLVPGSGLVKKINGLSCRDSLNYLNNPSFDRFVGDAGSPTSISDWNIGPTAAFANVDLDSSFTFRDYDGAPATSYSLKFTASTANPSLEINQDLKERRIAMRPDVPMYVQIAVHKPASGGSGTVELDLGGVAIASVNVADLTEDRWVVIRLATGTAVGGGTKNWYDNQRDNVELILDITLSGLDNTRVLYIDDVIVAPFTEFDGSWYAFAPGTTSVAGGAKKPERDDSHTWSDSAVESIVQKWIWRIFRKYLPHSASPTWADPT